MITITSPTRLTLSDDYWDKLEEVKEFLTYTDKTVLYEIQRMKNSAYYLNQHGEEAYYERINELKASSKVCLLNDKNDKLTTYSGLAQMLANKFNDEIKDELELPKANYLPWFKDPKYQLRYYQLESVERLIKARHACIGLATGSGKSPIALQIIKELGLKSIVMSPSISIANQLYDLFTAHLGGKYVGIIGDGKKRLDKLITIGIAASLAKIKPDSPEWSALSDCQVFLVDESHLVAAETLESVCSGLAANAPYRFFLSATQMRNDGSELLLNGIIGPMVYELPVQRAINEGFLAKPNFLIYKSKSNSKYESKDPLRMMAKHLYNNALVHKQAAEMANQAVSLLNHQVLIMIDHVEQFQYLLPHLRYETGFAHGGVSKTNRDSVDPRFYKSDVKGLVSKFNEGRLLILVGTSCISIGTDIKPVKSIFNLQSGKSEVKFKQLVGRGTRKVEGKDCFNFIDFDIENIYLLHNQLKERVKIYNDIYPNVKFV